MALDAQTARRASRITAVLLSAGLLVACGTTADRVDRGGEPVRSSQESQRGSQVTADERAVIEAYRRWLLVAHATSVDPVRATADVEGLRARLSRVAGPAVVDAWIKTLLERAANGIATRRDGWVELMEVERVTVSGDRATFVGCVRDGGVLYDTASGRDVDAAVEFNRVTAEFVRNDAAWKFDQVTGLEVLERCNGT